MSFADFFFAVKSEKGILKLHKIAIHPSLLAALFQANLLALYFLKQGMKEVEKKPTKQLYLEQEIMAA